ncbi:MAG: hypothetical protein KJ069_21355 [Anaerolineae bacterium]|nr:hypothetical protein [Anaerolineae bacterium]
MDLIDLDFRSVPLEQLASMPVSVIRSIGNVLCMRFEMEMGVKTVAELARWPGYVAARAVVSQVVGGVNLAIDEDPEMPSDLIPGTGRYPTERVQYDILLLDKVLSHTCRTAVHPASPVESQPTTGDESVHSSSPVESQPVGEMQNSAPVGSIPIEAGFMPLDVGRQPETGFITPAVGLRLTYNQSWYGEGLALGHLLHSVALAPGESTRIAVIDWNRQQRVVATETITETEALTAELLHNRSINEITNAVATEAQTGFSKATNTETTFSSGSGSGAAGEYMGFFGVAGISFGNSLGTTEATSVASTTGRREIQAEMQQNICDHTQQAANSVRNRRASIVREVSQKESETLSTRTITNFNHMHALTIQYYEVVQLYRTAVELAKVTQCLFLPMKILDFDAQVTQKYRAVLQQAAFSREIRELLRDDLSIKVVGRLPGGQFSEVVGKLANECLKEAQERSHLELRGNLCGQWYVPRTVGLVGYQFRWPLGVKVAQLAIDTADGLELVPPPPEDQDQWGRSFAIQPLNRYGSFEITLAANQGESIELPVRVMLQLDLMYLGRKFPYRHVVEIGGEESCGQLGQRVSLVKIATPAAEEMVLGHLQANNLYYSQAVWKSMSSASLMAHLEAYSFMGRPLAEMVDFTPIAVVGNYIVFAFHNSDHPAWREFLQEHPDINLENPANRQTKEEIVPIPSGGVFAEAVLGRFNSAEKLDITRFWNWQDSPIPITAPEIAPLQAGSRAQVEQIIPGELGQPVLNIVNAPALPDPTGMNAVLNTLANGALFRDMSNVAGTMTAATEALKAGFMAAGHSEDVAAQYAQMAANLKAGKMGQSSNGSGGQQGMINSDQGISKTGMMLNYGKGMDQSQPVVQNGSSGTSTQPSSSGADQTSSAGHEEEAFDTALYGSSGASTQSSSGGAPGVLGQLLNMIQTATPTTLPPGSTGKGLAYAAAASNLVQRFRRNNTMYGPQLDENGHRKHDFLTDDTACDCTKFVLLATLIADNVEYEGKNLHTINVPAFGNKKLVNITSVTGMEADVNELVNDGLSEPIRLGDPKVGDIMFWGRHVAIVTNVRNSDTDILVSFANMWRIGAVEQADAKLEADIITNRYNYGSGGFNGFWTPATC